MRSAAAVRQREQSFLEQLEAKVLERTAALARSEANIRAVLETSHLYMAMLAPDGAILYVNATALAGIGARFNELAYMPFWESPGSPRHRYARGDARDDTAGSGRRHRARDHDPEHASGRARLRFLHAPGTGRDGSIVATVPEALDISERVNAEQALQQLHKMEALGNLTGGIAHDFNNLLMAVLGSLDLLRRRMPADPALLRRWTMPEPVPNAALRSPRACSPSPASRNCTRHRSTCRS